MKDLFEIYKDLPQYHLNSHLIIACASGQLEHVQFLLTNKNLKEKADIHCDEDGAFISICMYGFIEHYHHILAKKLLQNRSYKEPQYEDLLIYFIFDREIEKTNHIVEFLTQIKEKQEKLVSRINKMFEIRELKNQLENSLRK